jgi:hypothetical protein
MEDGGRVLRPLSVTRFHCREADVIQAFGLLFAYFGPETVMPMTSVIATVAAIVMMFGKTIFHYAVGWLRKGWYLLPRGKQTPAPHLVVRRRRNGGIEERIATQTPKVRR